MEGESIVGIQEICPEVVAAINESALARAAEKRRVAEGLEGLTGEGSEDILDNGHETAPVEDSSLDMEIKEPQDSTNDQDEI